MTHSSQCQSGKLFDKIRGDSFHSSPIVFPSSFHNGNQDHH
jgi:hypothetical protein